MDESQKRRDAAARRAAVAIENMIRDLGRTTSWHVTANEVWPYARTCWLGYCQYTPTDMLACDHG